MIVDFNIGRDALSEQVAQRLEDMILSNGTQPGTKLPSEQTLATGFAVSRSVLREALAILRDRGLISQKQGSGCFIAAPEISRARMTQCVNRVAHMKQIDSQDVFEARISLETGIVRLAAENATPEDIQTLRDMNRRMRDMDSSDFPTRAQRDLDFHLRIAQIAGNELLAIFLDSLGGLLMPMTIATLSLLGADESGASFHDRIIQCLEEHDADEAEEIMRQHLTAFMSNWEAIRE